MVRGVQSILLLQGQISIVERVYGSHLNGLMVTYKLPRDVYYCPTIENYALECAKTIHTMSYA